jgi:hypothetical protein
MSIIETSAINSESDRLEQEIQRYRKLIEKAKNKTELSKKESKVLFNPVCLSNLRSPISNKTTQLSKDELNEKLRHCANCLIKLGQEVLP